jgi:hypothetical protein
MIGIKCLRFMARFPHTGERIVGGRTSNNRRIPASLNFIVGRGVRYAAGSVTPWRAR